MPINKLFLNSIIVEVRRQKVILDSDLAPISGVPTKVLNPGGKKKRGKVSRRIHVSVERRRPGNLRSQFVTSRGRHAGRRYLPQAFTEHGAFMAATVLNSDRAVAMSVYIIRAFLKMREDLAANAAILKRLTESTKPWSSMT